MVTAGCTSLGSYESGANQVSLSVTTQIFSIRTANAG